MVAELKSVKSHMAGMCHGTGFGSDCFRARPGCVMVLGLIVTNCFRGCRDVSCHWFDSDCIRGRPGCVMPLGMIVIVSGGAGMCHGAGFDSDCFLGRKV